MNLIESAATDPSDTGAVPVADETLRQDRDSARFVVAEMNTHHFMFRGAGHDEPEARAALLRAWTRHRTALLERYPERANSIPAAAEMDGHFKICYLEFAVNAGYRDGERLV